MMTPEKFLEHAGPYIRQSVHRTDVDLSKIAALLQNRTEVFTDIPAQVDFIDSMPDYDLSLYENKMMKKNRDTSLEVLKKALPALEGLTEWNMDGLHECLFGLVAEMGVKNGYVLWPVRVAISGKQFTPGGALEIADIIGREDTLSRMRLSIDKLSKG